MKAAVIVEGDLCWEIFYHYYHSRHCSFEERVHSLDQAVLMT